MAKFVEYQWGWDVTVPELITERMWNETYEVYLRDKYDFGLKEFCFCNSSGGGHSSNSYSLIHLCGLQARG